MSYNIALNFEDGVTRFVSCNEGETVLDAAYRAQINLPMDCSDGVCGTCKGACHQGKFDMGEEYLDEALSGSEAEQGMVLTCQMIPSSDCVVEVPVASSMCKTGNAQVAGTVAEVNLISPTSIELKITADEDLAFLPGQYVNIKIPGTEETRAYSFSSNPGSRDLSFLIRNIPGGLMSSWLVGKARTGDKVALTGPMGSFYLRPIERPVLMLAGGTGLAPFLAKLEYMKANGSKTPTHLIYGVSNDDDLVYLSALDQFVQELKGFSYVTCVSGAESDHPRKGYVTHHMDDTSLNEGDVDVYLCGPPPMVDSVLGFFREKGIKPNSFHYEKFTASAPGPVEKVA
ncbi:benzoate 1,2-dioxygenase electron transfer component BenC [Marinobacter psychrophilus]|jgi:benzoate/toluate 1,2-dioxygenase reductase subunit|uniref:benzoate 1,2-dioxygenase electron transfer component BenC n=1 Tax=Marinobacter psychrophilus TaxID=330734 RepID=UPI001B6A375D|nr:benzoate 1,2-dioxygenase electron transfer component BenC [Marinobacter psychrophilus]MBQ0761841.1 ring-hydroxylating dioxygenase ferredoxin reductase family protein [Marinobacter psychrophilus]MBQ0846499.1 ring-hydroxylating dioxygenase ferredoxin reductase family protein [Marinobacter psychrophilus]